MSSPDVAFFFAFLFFLLASGAANLDIGKTLSGYLEFSYFVNMLNETCVADEINSRQTITVLAVPNGNLGGLYGQTMENKEDGVERACWYLNMTNTCNGTVYFASSSANSHIETQLVKQFTSKPYDLSVLQIINLIDVASVSPAPAKAPDYAPPPRKVLAPAPSPNLGEVDNGKSPAPSKTKASDASPPVADADTPGGDEKKSAVSAPCGDYLASTLLSVFTCAWLLLTMV
ncbi:hypothetical protein F3Y22_tig00000773pilonHSYRG00279 [Hibiscus syriacus]|uniref:Uncharacterized protein n=1 Tax=Hibiscus syriacus TaxID=106335 RepID=A0A6A3D0X9_HIBSY|nr:hypothetical protein F3Y22_tig00000773pilonHSYRG00279 [Hibiscus syriacus]